MSQENTLERRLERLSHLDDFVAFLGYIYDQRESLIQQLHDVDNARLQQISGRILQCDDILTAGGWSRAQNRR